jgi:integrase/recombinase XerC
MTTTPPAADLDAARLLLNRLGVTPEELLAAPAVRPTMPTFAQYIPIVSAAVSEGTRRAYGTYWKRIKDNWGERHLDEPTPSEIKQLVADVRANVVVRRNARGGRSAGEHLIAALRCLYKHAQDDNLITEADNPAERWPNPGGSPRPDGR